MYPTSDTRTQFKVLVPTDFSDISRNAVAYVFSAFGDRITHLLLLNAYKQRAPEAVPMITLADILHEKSVRMMQIELKHIHSLQHGAGLLVQTWSRFQGLLESMVEISEEEDVDLIVMGSNGNIHPRVEAHDEDPGFIIHKLNRPLMLVPKLLN